MRDIIDLGGTTPPDEDCAQLLRGQEQEYRVRALAEAAAYIEAVKKKLGEPPIGVVLRKQWHEHDFGQYLTVVCSYEPSSEAAADYAFKCESDGPATWAEVGMVAPEAGKLAGRVR